MLFTRAASCCGVAELTGIDGLGKKDIEAAIAAAHAVHRGMIIYYSVNPKTSQVLMDECGFRRVTAFKNPNTQRDVLVLMRLQKGIHLPREK